jgi:hypothetical protein
MWEISIEIVSRPRLSLWARDAVKSRRELFPLGHKRVLSEPTLQELTDGALSLHLRRFVWDAA